MRGVPYYQAHWNKAPRISQKRFLWLVKNVWASMSNFVLFCLVQTNNSSQRQKLLPGLRPRTLRGSSRAGLSSPSAATSPQGCKTGTPAHAALPETERAIGLAGGEPERREASWCNFPSSQEQVQPARMWLQGQWVAHVPGQTLTNNDLKQLLLSLYVFHNRCMFQFSEISEFKTYKFWKCWASATKFTGKRKRGKSKNAVSFLKSTMNKGTSEKVY